MKYLILLVSVISLIFSETQTMHLQPWMINLEAFYVIPENPELTSIFQPLADDGIDVSIEFNGNVLDYTESTGWVGEDIVAEPYKCYRITLSITSPYDLVITGALVQTPFEIEFTAGNNHFGYSLPIEQHPNNFLEGLFTQAGILLVTNDYGGFYAPEMGVNTIGCLSPGDGYNIETYNEGLLIADFYSCEDCLIVENWGDLNLDGSINILDIIHLVNAIIENDIPDDLECLYDPNSDGEIDILDIVHIINYIVG